MGLPGHKRLDAAVFAAYGWKSDLSDEEILEKLLALNLDKTERSRRMFEGCVPEGIRSVNNEDRLIYDFIDNLIKSAVDPGEIHICPICNGKIHVGFGAYKRGEESLFGVQVKCESCDIQMALDYGVPPPPWLNSK